MDEYMQCLYDHISGKKLDILLRNNPKYLRCADTLSVAGEALEAMLSPEQQAALDRYESAFCAVTACQEEALFRESVFLGCWLGRQTASP